MAINNSLTVWSPRINLGIKATTYGDAFSYLNLPQTRNLPEQRLMEIHRRLAMQFHPDKNPGANNNEIMGDISTSVGAVRRFSSTRFLSFQDPLWMTPRMKFRGFGASSLQTFGLFIASDFLLDGPQQKIVNGNFDPSLYWSNKLQTGLFAGGFSLIQGYGNFFMHLTPAGSGTLAFGGLTLGSLRGLPDNYKGIGVIGGSLSLTTWITMSHISTPIISRLMGKGKLRPGVAGAIQFLLCNTASTAVDTTLQKFYQTELGYNLVMSDGAGIAGKVLLPATDWLWYTHALNGTLNLSKFSSAAMKKAPGIGTLMAFGGTTISSWSMLTSGDPWTMGYAYYKIAKEVTITYLSASAGIYAAGLSIETGPGAFFIGAGTYILTDMTLREGFNWAEDNWGIKRTFEQKLVEEPLENIGIQLLLDHSGAYRPNKVIRNQDKVFVEDLRKFLTGELLFEGFDEDGKRVKRNLKEELKATGITQIVAENICDLSPLLISQIISYANQVNPDGNKKLRISIKYGDIMSSENGTMIAYVAQISEIGADKAYAPILIYNALEPVQKEKNVSLEEMISGQLNLFSGDTQDLPSIALISKESNYGMPTVGMHMNSERFFSEPHMATMQISQSLENLGVFGIRRECKSVVIGGNRYTLYVNDQRRDAFNESGGVAFLQAMKSNSYEDMKAYLKGSGKYAGRTITNSLLQFQRILLDSKLLPPAEAGSFGKFSAFFLLLLSDIKVSGRQNIHSILGQYYSCFKDVQIKKLIEILYTKEGQEIICSLMDQIERTFEPNEVIMSDRFNSLVQYQSDVVYRQSAPIGNVSQGCNYISRNLPENDPRKDEIKFESFVSYNPDSYNTYSYYDPTVNRSSR